MSNRFTALILGLILVTGCLPLVAQTYTLQRLTIPYAPNATIWAEGINNRGAIVGAMANSHGSYSFKRDANGVFELPIYDSNSTQRHHLLGINDSGVMVGYYDTDYPDGMRRGFLLYHGVFTEYIVQPGWNTEIHGINNKGDFVGAADVVDVQHIRRYFGFVNSNGVVSKIYCPGGNVAIPYAIAADGTIVGTCPHIGYGVGFIRGPAGHVKTFQVPGTWLATSAYGINNVAHKIVGYYTTQDVHGYRFDHGFVYDYLTDIFTTIDWPGHPYNMTYITGINSKGVIVGWARPFRYGVVGFVGTPQ